MNFKEAYQKMLEGKKIRRKGDNRYFYYDKDMKQVFYYISEKCFDNLTVNIETEDALAEDWEVVEETKSKEKVWKPDIGDLYSYITSTGEVSTDVFSKGWLYDEKRVDFYNSFKTKEDAKNMIEKLKVIKELEDFALKNNDERVDWRDRCTTKYFITYDFYDEKISTAGYTFRNFLPFEIYFTSKEIAEEAIKIIGEDRIKKYYFDIED